MEFRAVAKYVRISPQKVILIIDGIKGQPVEKALNYLKFMPQKSAKIVEKVIRSAVANASQHDDVNIDDLLIKNITADKGPFLKRFRPKARGRSTRILKRSSHITVVLSN